nr:MAG TPA: hypothetical protein [Caudoviricetes sp.]
MEGEKLRNIYTTINNPNNSRPITRIIYSIIGTFLCIIMYNGSPDVAI